MDIDISENSKENYTIRNFPSDILYSGAETDPGDFKIFIRSETLDFIDDYLSSDINNELGGVLTGEVCINDDSEMFIEIDNFIIARHSNSSISRLTFTHETWEYINDKLDNDFPGKKILGWFHSHPGHTVFLSNYDLFIQENFFDMEYMVAYVFDPTIKDRGFFYKKDGKIKKASGFYLFDVSKNSGKSYDASDSYRIDAEKNDIESSDSELDLLKKKKGGFFSNKLSAVSILLNLILFGLITFGYFNLKNKILIVSESRSDIEELKKENDRLKERLDNFIVEYELKNAGIYTDTSPVKSIPVEKVSITSADTVALEKNKPKENVPVTENNSAGNVIVTYKVKPGDTIEKITLQFYKKREKAELIVTRNNLKNKADIKIGQMLEIPDPENQ